MALQNASGTGLRPFISRVDTRGVLGHPVARRDENTRSRKSDSKFENVFFEIVLGIIAKFAMRKKSVSDALWSPQPCQAGSSNESGSEAGG